MKNKSLLVMFVTILLGTLSACSVSPVQQPSVNKHLAVVKSLPGWNPLSVISVHIYRIDDKKFKKAKNHELLPGQHEIEVRCNRESPERMQRYFVFDMYLKAGHVYKPKLDMSKDCYVYYVDVATGKKYIGVED
jgi:hypothetical protein